MKFFLFLGDWGEKGRFFSEILFNPLLALEKDLKLKEPLGLKTDESFLVKGMDGGVLSFSLEGLLVEVIKA